MIGNYYRDNRYYLVFKDRTSHKELTIENPYNRIEKCIEPEKNEENRQERTKPISKGRRIYPSYFLACYSIGRQGEDKRPPSQTKRKPSSSDVVETNHSYDSKNPNAKTPNDRCSYTG